MSPAAIVETQLSGARLSRRGKVRELYDLGDSLLLVASDRISAYDCVLSPGVPDKGKVLTQLSNFWFQKFSDVENHLI
ncbi:MAG: phosphoribosylaminoimidazolesuccinocarboxamide synthase, partial [Acidobacteriota bacterium]